MIILVLEVNTYFQYEKIKSLESELGDVDLSKYVIKVENGTVIREEISKK